MSSYLLITWVLSALAATGYSLTCIECSVLSDQICTAPSKLCPSGNYSCVLAYVETTMGGQKFPNLYIRQCGDRSMCNRLGSISLPNGRMKTSSTCCDTDNCTSPHPVLPEETFGKNGVKCKACYTQNANKCAAESVMDCVGKETECITQFTNTTGDISATTIMRGCATKEMCEPASQVVDLGNMVVHAESTCANSGVYIHQSLFPLIISVCLFRNLVC
ncbi:phospholipase A2 inhibitor and Ly6/PLAUR domain-containing protein-like [Mixophyes fleayi]|uniref:phospholipase A2 inhibitor and Ly6/PLAUR domain-containing protein-like n=1 Tax=Mixophyes fleayi TaxID=3061075 RepID=UPI003F4D93BC